MPKKQPQKELEMPESSADETAPEGEAQEPAGEEQFDDGSISDEQYLAIGRGMAMPSTPQDISNALSKAERRHRTVLRSIEKLKAEQVMLEVQRTHLLELYKAAIAKGLKQP